MEFNGIFDIQQTPPLVSTKMCAIHAVHALSSAVTNLTNKILIFHDFQGLTIKFRDFPGLENEILKFHDFPGFS